MDLRISTTTLEAYRKLCAGLPYMTEQDVVDNIKRVFIPRRPVLLGQAFHKILERPEQYRQGEAYEADGFEFSADIVTQCLASFSSDGVPEVKHSKEYIVGADRATVVAQADRLCGTRITEHKTKVSQFDLDSYDESYQHRYYLDIFEASAVDYRVYCLYDGERAITLRSIESFTFYPYLALRSDCTELLGRFLEFVHSRGLEPWLQPRVEAA